MRGCAARSRPRSGLTLIELIVVVAVIGILVALLLPAVQAAREAARRVRCRSNLRQLGLALGNYESALGSLPFGVGGGGPRGREPRWSAQSQLLSYFEQADLFNSLNFESVPWLHDAENPQVNKTALTTRVDAFLCPSDADGIAELFGLAHINYRANAGTRPRNLSADTPAKGGTGHNDGAFWYQSAIRLADIRDGMSNSVLFSERCLGSSSRPDQLSDYLLSGADLESCSAMPRASAQRLDMANEWSGERWGDGNAIFTRYHHIFTPSGNSCLLGGTNDYGTPMAVTATSRHPGGVHILLGDGSVRFAEEAVAPAVWRAVGTIAGGEIVSTGEF